MFMTSDQPSPSAVSAAEVLHKLVSGNSANGTSFYTAGASVVSQAEFYDCSGEGDTITVKQSSSDEPTEFIMSGVFQIDCCDFYFTPYFKFDPNNLFCTENLCALEKKALKEKLYSVHRTVQTVGDTQCIKFIHNLFEKVTQINDVPHKYNVTSGSDASSEDYDHKVAGAIIEVYFTLVHHSIRRSKKSVFNAVLSPLRKVVLQVGSGQIEDLVQRHGQKVWRSR
ncbi:hypothetical protein EV424DRAFT_1347035 [Suillus variegatus]|nr:hypothetical protein EV424DRAFT_1347035 [Suillus variegatus]